MWRHSEHNRVQQKYFENKTIAAAAYTYVCSSSVNDSVSQDTCSKTDSEENAKIQTFIEGLTEIKTLN